MPLNEPQVDLDPYYDERITEAVDNRHCPECGGYLEDLIVARQ